MTFSSKCPRGGTRGGAASRHGIRMAPVLSKKPRDVRSAARTRRPVPVKSGGTRRSVFLEPRPTAPPGCLRATSRTRPRTFPASSGWRLATSAEARARASARSPARDLARPRAAGPAGERRVPAGSRASITAWSARCSWRPSRPCGPPPSRVTLATSRRLGQNAAPRRPTAPSSRTPRRTGATCAYRGLRPGRGLAAVSSEAPPRGRGGNGSRRRRAAAFVERRGPVSSEAPPRGRGGNVDATRRTDFLSSCASDSSSRAAPAAAGSNAPPRSANDFCRAARAAKAAAPCWSGGAPPSPPGPRPGSPPGGRPGSPPGGRPGSPPGGRPFGCMPVASPQPDECCGRLALRKL